MAYDTRKMAADIRRVADEARAEHETTDDGGTCNMDSAYVSVPRMAEKQAAEIAALSGVHCYLLNSKLFGRILMVGAGHGQGSRNTAMSEDACEGLRVAGYKARVWYQID